MAYDLTSARESGLSDEAIATYLSGKYKYKIDEARKSGVSDSEIINYLMVKEQSTGGSSSNKMGMLDAMGIGAKSTVLGMGGIVGLSSEEQIRQSQKDLAQASEQYPIATTLSKVGTTLATALPVAFAGATVGPYAGLGVFGARVLGSMLASGVVGGGTYQERVQELQEKGASEEEAMSAARKAFPLDFVAGVLPAGIGGAGAKGLLTGVGSGAALNVAAGAGSRALMNSELPETAQSPIVDPMSMGLEAGIGAVFGAIGKVPVRSIRIPKLDELIRKPGTDDNPSGGVPNAGEITQITEATARVETEFKNALYHTNKLSEAQQRTYKTPEEAQQAIAKHQNKIDSSVRRIIDLEDRVLQIDPAQSKVDPNTRQAILNEQEQLRVRQQSNDPLSVSNVVDVPLTKAEVAEIDFNSSAAAKTIGVMNNSDAEASAQILKYTEDETSLRLEQFIRLKEQEVGSSPEYNNDPPGYVFATEKKAEAVHTAQLENFTPERMAPWDNEHLISLLEDKLVRYSTFLNGGHNKIANMVLQEAIYPLKSELMVRRLKLANTVENAALIKKIESLLGTEDSARLRSITEQEVGTPKINDPDLASLLKKKNLDAALDLIITRYVDDPVSIVASWIKNNKFLRPYISLSLPTNPKATGQYVPEGGTGRGELRFSEEGRSSPHTVVHEIIHNASHKILSIVEATNAQQTGSFLPKDVREDVFRQFYALPDHVRIAAQGIINLYKKVLGEMGEIPKDTVRAYAMSNPHEFLTYGLLKPEFSKLLMKYKGTSGFVNVTTDLFNKFASMLGFKNNVPVRTAMEELFSYGETVSKYSDGAGMSLLEQNKLGLQSGQEYFAMSNRVQQINQHLPMVAPKGFIQTMKEAAEAPDLVKSLLSSFSRHWFGPQQFAQLVQNNPIMHEVFSVIRKAKDTGEEFKNFALYGVQSQAARRKFGFYTNLNKIENGDSIPALVNSLPISDWIPVMKLIQLAGESRTSHAVVRDTQGQHLTKSQTNLHIALEKYADRVYDFENRIMTSLGDKPVIAYHPGYFPSVRKGDFEVLSHAAGVALYSQRTRTRKEALDLVERMERNPSWNKTTIEFIDLIEQKAKEVRQPELIKSLVEIKRKEEARGEVPVGTADRLEKDLELQLRSGGPLGGHAMFRAGVAGFEGKKLNRTELDSAEEFRQSYLDHAEEVQSLIQKRIIGQGIDPLLTDTTLIVQRPNSIELATHISNYARNNFDVFAGAATQKALRAFVDNAVIGAVHSMGLDKWYPKSHILDRTHGVVAHLFYISALTTRPGFWLAQALTSTQGMRAMFRTENTAEAFINIGKGMLNAASGGDKAFQEAVHWVASNLNTFHPSFVNEITAIGFKFGDLVGSEKLTKFLRGVVPWATGEKQTGIADAASRYISFAMFYEKYKTAGMTGQALWKAAAADTDSTMVQYNAPNKAPFIRKLGIVGDAIAPLQTFSTAQLGNLIADIKYIGQQKELASTLPLIITGMTTVLMGGVIGLPLIMEYEALRWALMATGLVGDQTLPSVLDWANQEETMEKGASLGLPKGSLSYGLPSAATGLDIGSGLRWNRILSGVFTEGDSILNLFPAISFSHTLVDNTIILFKDEFPEAMVKQAEARKAAMSAFSLVVGGKAAVDELAFGASDREFVPGGARGYAMRPQTDMERMSTLIGSGTIRAKQDRTISELHKERDKIVSDKKQKALDVFLDGIINGTDSERAATALEKMISLDMTNDQINEQLNAAYTKRNISQRERYYLNSKGKLSKGAAAQRYLRDERFGSPAQ